MKDLLLRLLTNLRTAKRISVSRHALQRRKETNDFHNVIFAEVFAKIIGKKAKTRFRLHTKLTSFLKSFQNTLQLQPDSSVSFLNGLYRWMKAQFIPLGILFGS